MNTSTLEKQLAPVAEGRSNMADLRTPRGNVVILSERLGERLRPVLEYMARQVSAESVAPADNGWTADKNSRRMVMRVIRLAADHDAALLQDMLGFPGDLPDLSRLHPPQGNRRPTGVKRSHFARRMRQKLPAVY